MSEWIMLSLVALYYVIGCFVFCWWCKEVDGHCDGDVIGLGMFVGWLFWPLELIAIALLKVFA